ncbi:MAG: serine/threonine protein kinase, partial [Armatimonadetes bacterium]|nr:serine/threonine protein kinase [Anaerolineae bacterium]
MDIGTEINQYQIVEHIGRGGMADVWSARDTRLSRMVAIKTIMHGLAGSDTDPVELFKREATTIAGLEHPHILPIYDFGEFRGKLYIVMRYMAGGTLNDPLERGALPVKEVRRIASAVSQALDFAHERKIVHLDLKPQNILLDSYEAPYLADFGLAAALDPDGRAQNPGSGTLMYMAPEQLTSKTIDYRADVYSFAVLLYHLFTGALPFDSRIPLALMQLQYQGELPELENFPPYMTQLLRRGTAVNPAERPVSTFELLEEIKTVLSDSVDTGSDFNLDGLGGLQAELDSMFMTGQIIQTDDADLLEAADIYSRARYAWQGGQGRFLLGVTHFLVMNNYYRQAERFGLTLDDEGRQMLLRGALEYDQDIDWWWALLDDANRRWVCLHGVRSATVPARIRSLYRLETLPDSEPPRIPKLVAQALQAEPDDQARIAALKVLASRARLTKPNRAYDIKTEYRGRLLSSLTRFELQVIPESDWQEAVFTPEIDTLLAQVALDTSAPPVADFAARVIGRIRSKTSVRYLFKQQRARQDGALRALALVRDEAPNLPDIVSAQVRTYAWLTNTWRRISDQPLGLTWRFLFAVLGGWLGLGYHVYATFRSEAILAPDRIANTVGYGLSFGVFVGVMVLLADEIPSRLRGFWTQPLRILFAGVLGIGWATLSWGLATWMYTRNLPDWDLMLFGGVGLALGFVLASLLNLRGLPAALLTAGTIYLTIYAPFNNFCQVNYICAQSPGFSVAPTALIGLLVGVFAGMVLRAEERIPSRLRVKLPVPPLAQVVVGGVVGLVWALAAWGIYSGLAASTLSTGLPWASVVALLLMSLITGALIAYLLDAVPRLAFAAVAAAAFVAVLVVVNPLLVTLNAEPVYQNRFAPLGYTALLYYDANQTVYNETGVFQYEQPFTVGIPFAVLFVLGGYAMTLMRDAR